MVTTSINLSIWQAKIHSGKANFFPVRRGQYEPEYPSAVENIDNQEISVFPNPTNGKINISTNEQIEKICVINIMGETIFETQNNNIDLTSVKTGTYIIRVQTNSSIFTEKIIKQ